MNHDFYVEMRNMWISSIAKKPGSEERAGGEPMYKTVLGTNPPNFIRMVLNAANDGEITLSDVSYYLNMKLKHLNLLENALG